MKKLLLLFTIITTSWTIAEDEAENLNKNTNQNIEINNIEKETEQEYTFCYMTKEYSEFLNKLNLSDLPSIKKANLFKFFNAYKLHQENIKLIEDLYKSNKKEDLQESLNIIQKSNSSESQSFIKFIEDIYSKSESQSFIKFIEDIYSKKD